MEELGILRTACYYSATGLSSSRPQKGCHSFSLCRTLIGLTPMLRRRGACRTLLFGWTVLRPSDM